MSIKYNICNLMDVIRQADIFRIDDDAIQWEYYTISVMLNNIINGNPLPMIQAEAGDAIGFDIKDTDSAGIVSGMRLAFSPKSINFFSGEYNAFFVRTIGGCERYEFKPIELIRTVDFIAKTEEMKKDFHDSEWIARFLDNAEEMKKDFHDSKRAARFIADAEEINKFRTDSEWIARFIANAEAAAKAILTAEICLAVRS